MVVAAAVACTALEWELLSHFHFHWMIVVVVAVVDFDVVDAK